jgi:hypothetical protein
MKKRLEVFTPSIQTLIDAGKISVSRTADEIVFSVSNVLAWPEAIELLSRDVAIIATQEEKSVRVVDPDGNPTVWPYRPSVRGIAAARARSLDGLRRLLGG